MVTSSIINYDDESGEPSLPEIKSVPALLRRANQGARNALCLPAGSRHGSHDMRPVDLTQVPAVPWAWVDEHVYAAIRGCSVKVLQTVPGQLQVRASGCRSAEAGPGHEDRVHRSQPKSRAAQLAAL